MSKVVDEAIRRMHQFVGGLDSYEFDDEHKSQLIEALEILLSRGIKVSDAEQVVGPMNFPADTVDVYKAFVEDSTTPVVKVTEADLRNMLADLLAASAKESDRFVIVQK